MCLNFWTTGKIYPASHYNWDIQTRTTKKGDTFRGQEKEEQSLQGKKEKQHPCVHEAFVQPLNTAARDLWAIQVCSWQLSVMQTLKTFIPWLQIALKITSNLSMVLKALKFLVPTYLSSTTFSLLSVLQTLWPSFYPLGLPCPLLPQGLCPD